MADGVGMAAGAGAPAGGDIGSIGTGGAAAFDLGGIAPNGGGPGPSGDGDLGAAGLSPIGGGDLGGLSGYDALVQQNTDTLKALGQQNQALSASAGGVGSPPIFTTQPLDLGQFTPPPSPGLALPPIAGGPVGDATMATMPPIGFPSLVTSPAIAAPTMNSDPFAPIGQGGLGLSPIGTTGPLDFAFAPTGFPSGDTGSDSRPPVPGEAAPPQAPKGFFERAWDKISDNFNSAFSTPVGPGPEWRNFVAGATTPNGSVFDVLKPLNSAVYLGLPTLADGTMRGIGAGFSSTVDTFTEGLVSAGMDPSDAGRLGRDLKAMTESSAGSMGGAMRPGAFLAREGVQDAGATAASAFRSAVDAGQPFDAAKLGRIQTALEKQGVSFVTGEEGARMAKALGGEALYIPEAGRPGIMVFGPNPTQAQVVEELMHYGQHKAAGFGDVSGNVANLEVQAQNKLLQVGPGLGWSPAELDQIERARQYWLGK